MLPAFHSSSLQSSSTSSMAIDLNIALVQKNGDPLPDLNTLPSIPTTTMAIDLNTKLDENGDPMPDLNEKHVDDQGPEIHSLEEVYLQEDL
jgi:hypothetical protein